MARLIIDEERCKGCSLCTVVCPLKILELSVDTFNNKGYHTVVLKDAKACSKCGMCSLICPDCAILIDKE